MAERGLFVGLLGPLALRRAGREVHIGSAKQRLVLGALAVAGRALSTDELIDVLWADDPPATAVGTLQTHVSRLRALIGAEAVVETGGGYQFDLAGGQLDSVIFTGLVTSARQARDGGNRHVARHDLVSGLALWRGPALSTFRYEPFAQLEIARLEALRLEAIEDRCELDIDSGDTSVVSELESLTAEHPFRERLTLLLMRALYQAGRQADALAAARRLRHALREDLGLGPSTEVVALEQRILQQDLALSTMPQEPMPRRFWQAVAERIHVPAPEPTRQADQLIEQAVTLRRAGRLTDARSSAAAAVRLASGLGDHRRLGAAGLALAGPPEDAVLGEPLDTELLELALAGIPADDPLAPMLQARLAVGYIDAGDRRRGATLLDMAEAAAAARGDTEAELYVLRARHRTWFDPTALNQRLALSHRMEELAVASAQIDHRAWASRWLAIDLLEAGDLAGFDHQLQQVAAANEQIHDPFHHWGVVARRAGERSATGPLDEADELTMEALGLAVGLDSDYTVAATGGLLFVLRWRQGRLDELDQSIQELAAREPLVRPVLLLLHLELGRHDDARRCLDDLTRHGVPQVLAADATGSTHLLALTALGQAAFHLDDGEVAAQVLEQLGRIESTMAVGGPGIMVLAPVAELRAAALGCLGNLDEAITQAEAAADLCNRTGCAAIGIRTSSLLAVLLRRRGCRDGDRRVGRLDHEIRQLAVATGAVAPPWYPVSST
jgi:DNA-binding SARP family transcriptional activator